MKPSILWVSAIIHLLRRAKYYQIDVEKQSRPRLPHDTPIRHDKHDADDLEACTVRVADSWPLRISCRSERDRILRVEDSSRPRRALLSVSLRRGVDEEETARRTAARYPRGLAERRRHRAGPRSRKEQGEPDSSVASS